MGLNGKRWSLVRLATFFFTIFSTPASACGLALLLAVDVSLSVDPDEYDLQMQGMAAALLQENVQSVFQAVPGGVAVSLVQWSGRDEQYQSLPWTLLSDPASLTDFAKQLSTTPRTFVGDTAPGSALEFSVLMHDANPFRCHRMVIDMSGDGAQNTGRHTGRAAELAVNFGITVNGLAIKGSDPRLETFFLENVVRGPKSFLEVADGFEDFARAFQKKLLKEVPIELALLFGDGAVSNDQLLLE